MKIYIIGSPGSGKTTLAKYLSKKYQIESYELDCIVYDDQDNHRHRTEEEVKKLFSQILKKDNWIIEDVGRTIFANTYKETDKIYYLKISRLEATKRTIKRWFKQRNGKENYNFPPTFANLFDYLKIIKNYYKKEPNKIAKLNKYPEKLIFINKKELNKIERNEIDEI